MKLLLWNQLHGFIGTSFTALRHFFGICTSKFAKSDEL